jgi:hypothetical protein
MATNDLPFSQLKLTIDKREQDRQRRNHIRRYFENLGGEVEVGWLQDPTNAIEGSYDYLVEGTWRGVDVKLGIEYKRIDDMLINWKELQFRLAKSIQHTPSLALFIEGPIKTHKHMECRILNKVGQRRLVRFTASRKSYIVNPCAPWDNNEIGELLPLITYDSKCAQWQEQKIQIRQFDELEMFGEKLENVLGHLVPSQKHPYIELDRKHPKHDRLAFYLTFPGVGAEKANKLADKPLFYWLKNFDEMKNITKNSTTDKMLSFMGSKKTVETFGRETDDLE